MPLAAWLLALLFKMPPDLSAGMVLVGSVASGTASNVMIHLAKGDVALSHHFIGLHAGRRGRHTTTHAPVRRCPYSSRRDGYAAEHSTDCSHSNHAGAGDSPSVSARSESGKTLSASILDGVHLAIISAVVAGSASHIASVGFMVIIAVILHNTLGLLGGYWGGRLFGFDESTCRTLAIEVGMQNSGLAAALVKSTFARSQRCPRAVLSVAQPSGSLLAGYWSGKPIVEKSGETAKVN